MMAKILGELVPIACVGGTKVGQLIELYFDVVECKAKLLGRDDERDATDLSAFKPSMSRFVFVRMDQPQIVVVADC